MMYRLLTGAGLFFLGCLSLRAQSFVRPAGGSPGAETAQQQEAAPPSAAQNPAPTGVKTLTLVEAEAIALKNNPQISVARLEAL